MSVGIAPFETSCPAPLSRGWLRNPTFDLNFIVVVAAVSILSGAVALVQPNLFSWVLFLDVWLLGYHHVISTFTRLTFDGESFRKHRFLVVQLPIIVLVATLAAVLTLGYWILPTVYFYWQWFHYTRQSYGIERAYRRRADKGALIHDYATTRALYLLPAFGILYRSYQAHPTFLGMTVKYLPINAITLSLVALLAVAAFGYWTVQVVSALRQGRLAIAHTLYVVSHVAIFMVGYVVIDDVTTGWLVLNVWHNLQYIMFVWSFNNNRFENRVEQKCRFLSTICQKRNLLAYLAVCLGLSTVVYAVLSTATGEVGSATAIPVTLIVFMVINFHHYVVDGMIWRRPRKKVEAAAPAG